MKHLLVVLALFSGAAVTQTADMQTMDDAALKQHAAETVAHLHDTMLDPESFVLDGAYKGKNIERDTTAEVAALAPALYRKTR